MSTHPTLSGTASAIETDGDLVLGQIGPLQVRLVSQADELDASQALRYQIFSTEFGAQFDGENEALKRDRDQYDALCDHLVVVDTSVDGSIYEQLVGTYRVSVQSGSEETPLYSQGEFDVAALIARHQSSTFLELGRSCVLPAYRGRRTIELLWQGIWAYCRRHAVDAMIGCASFPGKIPQRHALALSFLHHHARSQDDWAVSAHDRLKVDMDMMPAEAINMKAALIALPALIKGYLRLGARFGEGAVIDPVFASTDVLVVLPVAALNPRYVNHYGENADRFAA